MARIVSIVATIILLAGLLLPVQAEGAALPSEFNDPVDFGIAWLVDQQKPDGSWGDPMDPNDPDQCHNNYRVEKTAFAVLKMLDRSRELQQPPPPAVQTGLDFILRNVRVATPAGIPDDVGSIWDYYNYKKDGCYESKPPIVPETSAAIIAILSVNTPNAIAPNGMTHKEIVQGAVNYLAFAQRQATDSAEEGGWTFAHDGATSMIETLPSDQVNTGYAALALVFARKQLAITVDPSVETHMQTWISNIQRKEGLDVGGATLEVEGLYTDVQYTGALLVEQYLLGRNPDQDADVQAAISYIEREWDGWAMNCGGSLGRYFLTSGLVLMKVDTLKDGQVDWFGVLTSHILGEKVAEGVGMYYWPADVGVDTILPTARALLTLEGKVGGLVADDPLSVPIDIKPGSCPNAFNRGDRGVMSVAVVGTSEFDVTKIDPESITLNGVSALRSGYEDVATPYSDTNAANDPTDCTTDEADGFVDLVLKFDHQDIAATLPADIPPKGYAYPLILTGTLKEEFGTTPITGTDHIWVVE